MLKVGLIGWRGMVGSVLCGRFDEENDWAGFQPFFFSTSKAGESCPLAAARGASILDAKNINELSKMDILLSTQGGSYTEEIYPKLRAAGWTGYWIDAASTLRMKEESTIVLDPINGAAIKEALKAGGRDFIGGNCTVSLLLLAIHGLLKADLIEWVSSMTYQAASGGGAAFMSELLKQYQLVGEKGAQADTALSQEILVRDELRSPSFPCSVTKVPLAASLIPWIDVPWQDGRTKEEWKAMAEGNKILDRTANPLPIDGLCVRVGSLRCHSQGLTIKLRRPAELNELEELIKNANSWVRYIPNEAEATRAALTPAAVSGTLDIAIGRLHHLAMGKDYIGAFTVGDQLLWGAAEPLRRVLNIIISQLESEQC